MSALISLPKVIDYSTPLETIPPDTTAVQVVCNPISSSPITAGSQFDVDLQGRGFLVPNSLMIRYKGTTTSAAETYMCGTPVYTPIQRVATTIGSLQVENLASYNVLANFLTNTGMDVSQKLGVQYAYGWAEEAITPMNNENVDGGYWNANSSKFLSAPLHCSLSYCEKLFPLFAVNGVRLTFTIDSIENMFALLDPAGVAAARPTAFSISNFEVVYQMVDFGAEVERMVLDMGEIRIKSQSFPSATQSLPSGTSGQQNLPFNIKSSSIKSLFLNMGGTTRTVSANGNMDSYDITTAGDYQFYCNSIAYPQKPLSVVNNRAGILQVLRQALGSVFDKNNSLSINTYEFYDKAIQNTATTVVAPAKFWVGCSLERLRLPIGGFFSGVPSGTGAIVAQINITSATSQAYNVMLIANVDYIFKLNTSSRQVEIVQ